MKLVTQIARFHIDKCVGCKACAHVCPTKAFRLPHERPLKSAATPQYLVDDCRGCTACEQRCPASAITMEKLEQPFTVGVEPSEFNQDEILRICTKAKMHPKQIVCFCTSTRAEEIVAAILKGARNLESISLMTGAHTACLTGCPQGIIRLLVASGQKIILGETHQSYGETFTLWDVDPKVLNKYEEKGYRFIEDMKLLEKVFKKEK